MEQHGETFRSPLLVNERQIAWDSFHQLKKHFTPENELFRRVKHLVNFLRALQEFEKAKPAAPAGVPEVDVEMEPDSAPVKNPRVCLFFSYVVPSLTFLCQKKRKIKSSATVNDEDDEEPEEEEVFGTFLSPHLH